MRERLERVLGDDRDLRRPGARQGHEVFEPDGDGDGPEAAEAVGPQSA